MTQLHESFFSTIISFVLPVMITFSCGEPLDQHSKNRVYVSLSAWNQSHAVGNSALLTSTVMRFSTSKHISTRKIDDSNLTETLYWPVSVYHSHASPWIDTLVVQHVIARPRELRVSLRKFKNRTDHPYAQNAPKVSFPFSNEKLSYQRDTFIQVEGWPIKSGVYSDDSKANKVYWTDAYGILGVRTTNKNSSFFVGSYQRLPVLDTQKMPWLSRDTSRVD